MTADMAKLTRLTRMYGPAVRRKRISSICRHSGLASMYPASDWSGCSGPSWMSARMRSHYRPGLERAIWVTRVCMRRKDRSSISSYPLADLGRKTGLCHRFLLIRSSSFVCAVSRSFIPACSACRAPRDRAVKAGRSWRPPAGLGLDGPERGARLKQVGMTLQPPARIRSCAPC